MRCVRLGWGGVAWCGVAWRGVAYLSEVLKVVLLSLHALKLALEGFELGLLLLVSRNA